MRGGSTAALLMTLALAGPAQAQSPDPAEPAARAAYLRRTESLSWMLAGWSAASIASGAAMWGLSDSEFVRNVGIQNVAWGAIDAVLATIGLVTAATAEPAESAQEWRDQRELLSTVYWVNFGLDFAYIGSGGAMWAFSDDEQIEGIGAGFVFQGAFLLGYDFVGALVMRP